MFADHDSSTSSIFKDLSKCTNTRPLVCENAKYVIYIACVTTIYNM